MHIHHAYQCNYIYWLQYDLNCFLFLVGFERFVAEGKKLMKYQEIMEDMENSIEDKAERIKVLEGLLGYILSSTKV